MRRKLLPADHPQLGTGLVAYGSLLAERGELEAAEASLREALAILVASGERIPPVATCRHELGGVLERRGALAEAESQLLAALSIRRELFPPTHPELRATIERLVGLYEATGRAAEAERYRALLAESSPAS